MLVKKIAFGDETEAFIESRLTDGLNVIYSDDNNRGKTLVMQGFMYSIGYESIFPSSFKYKEKYFYSEIEVNGAKYEFLRKKNSIVVKTGGSIQVFNSVSELRYFLNNSVFTIPRIQKDNRTLLVDLTLLYEIFFIGQDNRNPSGLISKGQFNKSDFKNMVFELAGFSIGSVNHDSINQIKDKLAKKQASLKEIIKKIGIIKSNPRIAEVVSKSYDSELVQNKIKSINELNGSISKLRRSRQREINRKSKLEQLISELNSLNKDLTEGSVKCGECSSEKIIYSNNDLSFEVSNIDVRNGILKSITENINQKIEIINDYSAEINTFQSALNQELADTPPSFQQIILYQEQSVSDKDYDNEAFLISKEIENLKAQLTISNNVDGFFQAERNEFTAKLLEEMVSIYRSIDPNGNLEFEDIFTKKDATFSGSEGQEFYFCKIIALSHILNHEFPLIVDSFRDGELSSTKEDYMLDIYSNLRKQVILTSTLKDEEYKRDKYKNNDKINSIDYSLHKDCKILTEELKNEFGSLVAKFNGLIM
jgi:hypothetical protein